MPIRNRIEAYNVLEIHSSATQSEVRSAYKRLALKTHPDKNRNDLLANAKFQAVTDAFQMLAEKYTEDSDSDEGFPADLFDGDFLPDDFAEILFRYFFSGKGRTYAFSGSSNCNCIDCQVQRSINKERQEEEKVRNRKTNRSAPETKRDSTFFPQPVEKPSARYTYIPSQPVPPTQPPPVRPPGFDPHADWLSKNEGEVPTALKNTRPKRVKKVTKKNKTGKKNKMTGQQPDSRKDSGDNECSSDSDDTDGGVNATLSSNKFPLRACPAPEFGSDSGSDVDSDSDACSDSDLIHQVPSQAAKLVGGNKVAPGFANPSDAVKRSKAAGRLNHNQKSSFFVQAPPRSSEGARSSLPTPNSIATTRVGSYSASNTPVNLARSKMGSFSDVDSSPRTKQQPYTSPTVPTLEGMKLCKTFLLKHGKCKFGDKCIFSHGVDPKAALAATESDEGVALSPSRTTRSAQPALSMGRAQVQVNPSIGGFGRKSVPAPPPHAVSTSRSQLQPQSRKTQVPAQSSPPPPPLQQMHGASPSLKQKKPVSANPPLPAQKANTTQSNVPVVGAAKPADSTHAVSPATPPKATTTATSSHHKSKYSATKATVPQPATKSALGASSVTGRCGNGAPASGPSERDGGVEQPRCLYFNTKKGCKFGQCCRFAHHAAK